MKRFLEHLAEAAYAAENPVPGDMIDFEFGPNDTLVETVVVEISADGDLVLEATDSGLAVLAQQGLMFEDIGNQSAMNLGAPEDSTSPISGTNFLPYERKQDPRKWMRNDVKSQEEDEQAQREDVQEAKYHGRSVPLGKPMAGDVKKSKVYVRKPNGSIVKVNFGDKTMKIKKSNPGRRKSFRARHHCENPGPRWKARYWSCRAW